MTSCDMHILQEMLMELFIYIKRLICVVVAFFIILLCLKLWQYLREANVKKKGPHIHIATC